jgi:hypothetical protein
MNQMLDAPAPIIVGYRCTSRDDANDLVEPPTPPKSYTKQETIDKWLEEKVAEFVRESEGLKITGQIDAVFAVDLRNGRVFDSLEVLNALDEQEDPSPEPLGCHFARWLLDGEGEYRFEFPDRHRGGDYGVAFYGFNLKPFLRVLGVESNTAGFEVPLGLWYGNEQVYDPYEMLVEAGPHRSMFPLTKVAKRGGLSLRNFEPGKDPRSDTRVVMELLCRFRLLSTLDVHQLAEMLGDRTFSTQRAAGESESAAEEGVDDADEDGVAEAPPASRKKKTRRKKATA